MYQNTGEFLQMTSAYVSFCLEGWVIKKQNAYYTKFKCGKTKKVDNGHLTGTLSFFLLRIIIISVLGTALRVQRLTKLIK